MIVFDCIIFEIEVSVDVDGFVVTDIRSVSTHLRVQLICG